ncbi:hypothetical protein CERSUDRAFT_110625 [Gelatoporia subvermispora B]|uniref:WW domain-containing protein n=1 Tax=Ceriporiopsis subvermispora (strain B) TaxID=914234 RepID=M2QY59_CERS8|nr:hypothetical protein CERSUDRAFT_110625 [Gelatoporia subvermispora B]
MYINPEGSPYYVIASHPFSIVTDSMVEESDTQEELYKGIRHIIAQIEDLSFQLPRNAELYIRFDKAAGGYRYYFVDHDAQTEFWLQDIEMASLSIPEVSSTYHMKHILQNHYWTHVEFFPYKSVPKHLRIRLADLLRHARADQMTSKTSTFPYNAQQCADFIQAIDSDEVTEYMTCLFAHIWAVIARHQCDHFYGEQHVRLCRDRGVSRKPVAQANLYMKICSALVFHLHKGLQVELELLYMDTIVYAVEWRTFITEITKRWQGAAELDVRILSIDTAFLFFPIGPFPRFLAFASILLTMGGILSATILLRRYAKAKNLDAAIVAVYLRQIEDKTLGFGPISATFCIPQACTLWSLLLFPLQILSSICFIPDTIKLPAVYVVACLVILAFILVVGGLRQASFIFFWDNIAITEL